MMNVQEVILSLRPYKTNNWPGLTRHIMVAVNEFVDEQDSVKELAYLYVNLRLYLRLEPRKSIKKFIRKLMDKIYIKCTYESRSYAAMFNFLRRI